MTGKSIRNYGGTGERGPPRCSVLKGLTPHPASCDLSQEPPGWLPVPEARFGQGWRTCEHVRGFASLLMLSCGRLRGSWQQHTAFRIDSSLDHVGLNYEPFLPSGGRYGQKRCHLLPSDEPLLQSTLILSGREPTYSLPRARVPDFLAPAPLCQHHHEPLTAEPG